jgi:sialic acid synthase SpsE
MAEFYMGSRAVGDNHPALIIAEAGINHDGHLARAIQLIDRAADAGADAVKFQLFRPDRMYAPAPSLYTTARGDRRPIEAIIRSAAMPVDWIPQLIARCRERGVLFLSSVCDEDSARALRRFRPVAYKIASYELNHLPLLRQIASWGKPILLSTAGARLSEVEEAFRTVAENGAGPLALMHCVASYPAPPEASRLAILGTLKRAFPEAVIGFSDHSLDPVAVPCAAVALGAKIIEKHFTIDKTLPGADHSFALSPAELTEMVRRIRNTETALRRGEKPAVASLLLGSSAKRPLKIEQSLRNFAFRGIFTTAPIRRGERLSAANLAVLRPGERLQGLHPRYWPLLTSGVIAVRDIPAGRGLVWDDVLRRER